MTSMNWTGQELRDFTDYEEWVDRENLTKWYRIDDWWITPTVLFVLFIVGIIALGVWTGNHGSI